MLFGQQLNSQKIFMRQGSDQTARMRRKIWGFAGRTYHIVGNLMPRLMYVFHQITILTTFISYVNSA